MKPSYVITADDFGLRPVCNERILALASEGLIDRVGIMIDGTVSEEESALLTRSVAALDIHLDFDISKSSQKRTKENPWFRALHFGYDFLSGRLRPSMVRREWTRQLDIFRTRYGKHPDGINSHEHIHYFPPYFHIAVSLAKERGIPYMRFGSDGVVNSPHVVSRILRILHRLDKRRFERSGLRSTAFMASLDWISDPVNLSVADTRDIELVTHPERVEESDMIRRLRKGE